MGLLKRIALTLGVQWHHDEMLALQRTVLPAGSLGPGTPETIIFPNEKTSLHLTSGLQISF